MGSRSNSYLESIGIKYIKCYFPWKICLQSNSTLPCCAFASVGHTTTPQFHHSFFFPVPYSGHRISLFSPSETLSLIVSFILHFIHCTFIIPLPAFASPSLHCYALRQLLHHTIAKTQSVADKEVGEKMHKPEKLGDLVGTRR